MAKTSEKRVSESEESNIPKYKLDTEDLKKIADIFAEEDNVGLNESFATLKLNAPKPVLVPVKLNKIDVQLLVDQLSMTKVVAEKLLQKNGGDSLKAIYSYFGY
uniref:HYPK_UBA domain-containing protein n=1 Tax=Rhabditophanes sp. KR3021 TaxID=114890 RepID=A0AC35TRT8_9BILA